MKNLLTASIVALTATPLLMPAAHAALSYNDGDLVVAFSTAATTPHTGNTLLVDFGNASQYLTGGSLHDGALHVVNSGQQANFLADLSAAGISLGSATYSIQGADLNSDVNVFLSKAEAVAGVPSTPWNNGSTGGANNDLATMFFSFGSPAHSSATLNSFIQNTNDTNSYSQYVFGSVSPTQAYDSYGNPEGSLAKVLDLYNPVDQATGASSLVGAFAFDPVTGALRFDSNPSGFSAVPEPATFAFGLAMVGMAGLNRRRTRQAVAA